MLIENQAAMETGGVGSLGSAAGRRRGQGRGWEAFWQSPGLQRVLAKSPQRVDTGTREGMEGRRWP